MQKIKSSGKMPIIDTFTTAGVIGLLMQQVVAIPAVDASKLPCAPEYCSVAGGYTKKLTIETIEDALGFLTELTSAFRTSYRSLATAERKEALVIIHSLKEEGHIDLIEQQLKAIDGTVKSVYQRVSDARKVEVKPIMFTVAKAKSAIYDLNHLISQMTVPVDIFVSDINREALRELAEHGTKAFYSGDIH
ncbi:hypothetical protein J1781_25255 [Rahnella sp. C60]|uniref:hypothetical protein n=1 Tax=Rahnella perminowiae TaxID=2816244 RepID=UPI001C27F843|nr:hypothetical protein [Rahnella perminowiae]MBU9818138.1 hypothetical protein [Rahnella perminowiae]